MAPWLKQQAVGQHVRRLRTQAGLSVRALAHRTGFSPSFVSQLEHGLVSPSIGSMEKIAVALGVRLGDFFNVAATGEGGLVVRAGERQAISSGWSNAEIETLSPAALAPRLDAMIITLRAGGRSGKHPYPFPREEFAFVLQGRVVLTLGPEEHHMRSGDAAAILAGESRLWRNPGRATARILIVASPGERKGHAVVAPRQQRASRRGRLRRAPPR